MVRKLVNICLAWTLVLGCWGGVLAAVACPHMGCETVAAAPEHDDAHAQHTPGASQESAAPEDHSAHTGEHQGHAAEPAASDQMRPESAGAMTGTRGAHDPYCSHCMGRPEAPPSPTFQWQASSAEKAGKDLASHAPLKLLASVAHVRQVTPAQHAPPGGAHKHLLLLNVFRI